MRRFFRRLGRGVGRALLWPFRMLGRCIRGVFNFIGDLIEGALS